MLTVTASVTIHQPEGWHARPATEFARIAGESGLEVTIGRAGEASVRGDSVLSLLTLGARQGEVLTISVSANTDAEAEVLLEALAAQF